MILLEQPESCIPHGFVNGAIGAHGSRTIMLKELRALLASCPADTDYEGFRTAVVDDNVLLKSTLSTRKESFRRLRELYALDPQRLLFRALCDLWHLDAEAQPLLAVLCALARDKIFRSTCAPILEAAPGDAITPQMLEQAVERAFPNRYNATTLANVGRHAASSWQQSGHLLGRAHKTRGRARNTPAATAYALFLAYLCGVRGDALFHSSWAAPLDTPAHELHSLAVAASQQGYLDYRHAGAVTEVTFRHFLRDRQEQ